MERLKIKPATFALKNSSSFFQKAVVKSQRPLPLPIINQMSCLLYIHNIIVIIYINNFAWINFHRSQTFYKG